MFIELHLIQNFAPSNLNRDDNNNPKDCEFGGVRRARVSSQCLKRAMRMAPVFAETTQTSVGTRTKYLVNKLAEHLQKAGKPEADAKAISAAFVPQLMSKVDEKSEEKKTAVLLYVGDAELASMAQDLQQVWPSLPSDAKGREAALAPVAKAFIKRHKSWTSVPDIALFGRMLAEQPELNLEAACQVAHAISTHRVTMEMDFYTAVDDLNPDDTAGAGMMGFTGYDSACFYRYARLDWGQLVKNLNGDAALARRTVEGFLRAAIEAVPSAKQNAFAANNPPSLAFAVVRDGSMGWSLANAFEKPVYPKGSNGMVASSVEALDKYWGRLCATYGEGSVRAASVLAVDDDLPLDALKDYRVANLSSWIEAIQKAMPTGKEA